LFTIVYTGDHYVVDIIAGIVIALISYLASKKFSGLKVKTNPEKLNLKKLILKPGIIAGIIIFTFSIFVTLLIKPKLKEYNIYQFSNLNFVDFINHPEKADSNYKIAIFLGDHYSSKGEQEGALCFYQKAQILATTPTEKFEVERKIKRLKLQTKSISGQISKMEPNFTLEYKIARKLKGHLKGSN
jgi:hypothetical protein